MIRLIKWLFIGDPHLHEWEVYNSVSIERKNINYRSDGYLLRCKHCGQMKTFFPKD